MATVAVAVGAVAAGAAVLSLAWRVAKRRPDVAGRTVFITGGSEGIGEAIAKEFVLRGANVVLMARTESKLKAAIQRITEAKISNEQKVGNVSMDVTDWESVKAGMQKAASEYGCPNFLVTSAGASYPGYFLDQEPEVFEQTMRLNYMGNVHAIKAVAPMMKENAGGNIMIVASAAAFVSFIGYSSYSPSKFALRGLADAIRSELSGFGINVSVCYPPDTETPGFDAENKTKPIETKACFPADAYPADRVARQSVRSLLAGDYHILSVDPVQNLLMSSMAGVTPRTSTVLEVVLLPFAALVEQGVWRWFDFQARRYARRISGEDETQGQKKDR